MDQQITARLVEYTQIGANVAQIIVLGAISATFIATRKQAQAASENLKLLAASNQFQAFRTIVEESRSLKSLRDELEQDGLPSYESLKKKYHSVHGIKSAPELTKVLHLGGFYEEVGVLIRRDFIDFTLVFDMVPFPDQIWKSAQSIIVGIRRDWIPDFWENFEYLHTRYEASRKQARGQKP